MYVSQWISNSISQHATLTERDEVDEKDLVRQRDEFEVGELHNGPDHPVLRQGVEVCALQLLPRVRTLQQRHGAQEAEQVGASKHSLIRQDARDDLEVGLAGDDDLLLQETEPLDGRWAKEAAAIEDHAASAAVVVVLDSLLFHQMLRHSVARREEEAGCDGLGEDGARGQLGLVPVGWRAKVSDARACSDRGGATYQRSMSDGVVYVDVCVCVSGKDAGKGKCQVNSGTGQFNA